MKRAMSISKIWPGARYVVAVADGRDAELVVEDLLSVVEGVWNPSTKSPR